MRVSENSIAASLASKSIAGPWVQGKRAEHACAWYVTDLEAMARVRRAFAENAQRTQKWNSGAHTYRVFLCE